ncbi:FadR/GntR family transcriptional regulator, partial [Mycobacterium timonense]
NKPLSRTDTGPGRRDVRSMAARTDPSTTEQIDAVNGAGGKKRGALLAAQIEQEIIELGWPTGRMLGSEHDLLPRYRVSRAVFREAVRLLEHHQVAEMRKGRHGGLFVMAPDPAAVVNAVSIYLRYRGVTDRNLFDVRQILEITSARLAAVNASEEAADQIGALTDIPEGANAGEIASRAADFHLAVAALSGNPVVELFVQVLVELTKALVDHSPARPVVEDVHHAHAAIAEAIRAADPALAQRRMLRHWEAMASVGFPVDGTPARAENGEPTPSSV